MKEFRQGLRINQPIGGEVYVGTRAPPRFLANVQTKEPAIRPSPASREQSRFNLLIFGAHFQDYQELP
jgi:hypothetical protein